MVLTVTGDVDLKELDCKLFQVHVMPDNRIKLIPVTLITDRYTKCPVIVQGERCGCNAGHEGKHMWGNGD